MKKVLFNFHLKLFSRHLFIFLFWQKVLWTPSKLIARLGKEINNESSYLYWAYKARMISSIDFQQNMLFSTSILIQIFTLVSFSIIVHFFLKSHHRTFYFLHIVLYMCNMDICVDFVINLITRVSESYT
jgi:hypothetical protein